jgi:phage shock protein PspC (stress-responsive transcriptional regulator)/predicted membrane protein
MTSDTGAHTGPPPPPPSAPRYPARLLRYPDEGPIAGVCAGLARYFSVDPTIVRIAAIVLACFGPGIPAYILAWIFVPQYDRSRAAGQRGPLGDLGRGSHRGHQGTTPVIGIVLIVIALSVLWGDWWSPAPGWFVPIGLMGVGAWLLLRRDIDDPPPSTAAGGPSPWRPSTPTDTADVADTEADMTTTDTDTTDTDTQTDADAASGDDTTAHAFGPWDAGSGEPPYDGLGPDTLGSPPVPPAPDFRRRKLLGPIVFGALLLWGGIAILAGVDLDTALAIGLCIVGLGFVLGAFIGGSWALVFPALLVGGALLLATVIDIPLDGGIGDREWTVTRASRLDDHYELGIGKATLDLSDLAVPRGTNLETSAKVGIGHLVVYVPEDVALEVRSEVGAGDTDILGRSDEGWGVDVDRTVTGDATKGTLHLDLEMGLGQVEVLERSSR